MKVNSKQLKKKKSFKEVYGTEIEILLILLCMEALAILAVASVYTFVFLCKKFGATRVIIGLLIATSILCIINFIICCVGKRKLAYLPLTKEECKELEITNLYEMLVFLNKFLKIRTVLSEDFSFVDYLNIDSQQAQAIIDLFSSDGEIRVKEPGGSEYYYSFYFLDGHEYKDIELLNKYKEEFEKIELMEVSNGQ